MHFHQGHLKCNGNSASAKLANHSDLFKNEERIIVKCISKCLILLLLLFPQSPADMLGPCVFDDNMYGLWCDLNGGYG